MKVSIVIKVSEIAELGNVICEVERLKEEHRTAMLEVNIEVGPRGNE